MDVIPAGVVVTVGRNNEEGKVEHEADDHYLVVALSKELWKATVLGAHVTTSALELVTIP